MLSIWRSLPLAPMTYPPRMMALGPSCRACALRCLEQNGQSRCQLTGQRAGRHAGKFPDLATEMRLIGIPRRESHPRQAGLATRPRHADEALEAENAVESLWPVAEMIVTPPPQGAFADVEAALDRAQL